MAEGHRQRVAKIADIRKSKNSLLINTDDTDQKSVDRVIR
jgi:hypothetical protein